MAPVAAMVSVQKDNRAMIVVRRSLTLMRFIGFSVLWLDRTSTRSSPARGLRQGKN